MHIGWITPTVGCFGAVREMVEVSNVLIARGHRVTIYHPDGGPVVWLPYQGETAPLKQARRAPVDAMIGIVDWQPELYRALRASRAAVQAVCLMGFDPTPELAAVLRGEQNTDNRALRVMRDAIQDPAVHVLADGAWQLDWVRRQVGTEVGVAFGGVNTEMFRPAPGRRPGPIRIGASGDPRSRKGSDVVAAAVALVREEHPRVEFQTYWGRRLTQEQLVAFYQDCDLFVDAHRRGGWCNPVVEAMACGCAVVCTRIGATEAVAEEGVTARVVGIDDPEALAAAIGWLLGDGERIRRLSDAAVARAAEYDYRRVVPSLERYLLEKVHG